MVFVILGGGCYGTFYARQLIRAAEAGAIAGPEIIVVDRNAKPKIAEVPPAQRYVRLVRDDWEHFLGAHLARLDAGADDQIVPPPFTPHLAVSWLLAALRRARPDMTWEIEPFALLPGTPFQRLAANGTLAASHADWICPIHCIEPDVCPKTRGPRYWDMADTAHAYAKSLGEAGQPIEQIHLFRCLHFTHGVGTYPAGALITALKQLQALQSSAVTPLRALIGTVSRCHGAMHLLNGRAGTDTVSRSGTPAVADAGGFSLQSNQ